jgi:hypothetical protein
MAPPLLAALVVAAMSCFLFGLILDYAIAGAIAQSQWRRGRDRQSRIAPNFMTPAAQYS